MDCFPSCCSSWARQRLSPAINLQGQRNGEQHHCGLQAIVQVSFMSHGPDIEAHASPRRHNRFQSTPPVCHATDDDSILRRSPEVNHPTASGQQFSTNVGVACMMPKHACEMKIGGYFGLLEEGASFGQDDCTPLGMALSYSRLQQDFRSTSASFAENMIGGLIPVAGEDFLWLRSRTNLSQRTDGEILVTTTILIRIQRTSLL